MEKEQWDEVLKTKDKRVATEEVVPHTHDQRWKLWKTTESYSVTSKRQFKVQIGRLSQLGFFWVTVGIGPQFCIMVRPSGHLFKHVFCIMKG